MRMAEQDWIANRERASEDRGAQINKAREAAQAHAASASPAPIASEKSPRIPSSAYLSLVGALAIPFLTACTKEAIPTPTSIPEPTPTVWPAGGGGLDSLICDPREVISRKDGATPIPPPSEADIIAFNACMAEKQAAGQATATAEAQETVAKRVIEQIGLPSGYRPATKEEIDYFAPRDNKPPFIERPAVKKDVKGNLLIPVYPPETILGKTPPISYMRSIIIPGQQMLGPDQEVQRWIATLEISRDLIARRVEVEREEAIRKLNSLKSRIEFISEANEAKGYNLDKNKDGISDYAEGIYQGIVEILKKLS